MNTTATTTMTEIESLTKALAGARDELSSRVTALKDELETMRRRRLQGIKNALQRTQTAHAELRAAVESAPELFEQPKTRTMHGFRVGWMKQRGKIEFPDADALVTAIRRMYGDDAEALVKVTEAPIRSALANLPARDLQKLGVTLTDDTDIVVIKPTDSELDKLLAALISDEELESLT